MGLVEVVEVEDQIAFWRGVKAEVSEVGIPADDGGNACRWEASQILGHHDDGATQKPVRRSDHSRDADGNERRFPADMEPLDQGDRIGPVVSGLPGTERAA